MVKFQQYKYIVLIILVLPLVYGYFNFLPEATKYLLDLFILLYFLRFRNIPIRNTSFSRLYIIYILVVSAITIFSIIIHEESVTHLIPEFRRLLIPLLLYLIVSDVMASDQFASIRIHKFLMVIMLIQIPITILQTILFPTFKQLNLFDQYRHYLDAATGTLGEAGHAYLGILIPLIIIYFYDLRLFKYIIPFIIPLILINSGGGIILCAVVFTFIGIYSVFYGHIVNRMRVMAGIVVLIGLLYLFSRTEFFRTNFYSYTRSFVFYTEHYIEGGAETFVGQEHKISRFNGYKLLMRNMDDYDYEQFFGLGFEFKEDNMVKGRTLSYKNDLNSIIAERGFLGLVAYVVLIVVFMFSTYATLRQLKYKRVFIKMLVFAAFFAGGLYNQTSRSFAVWLILLYFLALYENKSQYDSLLKYLSLGVSKQKKRTAHGMKGRTMPLKTPHT